MKEIEQDLGEGCSKYVHKEVWNKENEDTK